MVLQRRPMQGNDCNDSTGHVWRAVALNFFLIYSGFRTLEHEIDVGGHLLPVGTVAVLCHMTMAHNPQVLSF